MTQLRVPPALRAPLAARQAYQYGRAFGAGVSQFTPGYAAPLGGTLGVGLGAFAAIGAVALTVKAQSRAKDQERRAWTKGVHESNLNKAWKVIDGSSGHMDPRVHAWARNALSTPDDLGIPYLVSDCSVLGSRDRIAKRIKWRRQLLLQGDADAMQQLEAGSIDPRWKECVTTYVRDALTYGDAQPQEP